MHDIIPDGERLFAMPHAWDEVAARDLRTAQPDLHCIAALDRVGSSYLFACPGKEVMTKFVGVEDVALREGVVPDALAIDVDVFELPFGAAAMNAPFVSTKRRRLWLERERGLLAMRERRSAGLKSGRVSGCRTGTPDSVPTYSRFSDESMPLRRLARGAQ